MPIPPNDLIPTVPPFGLPTWREVFGGGDTAYGQERLTIGGQAHTAGNFSYGSFLLHDGVNFFLTQKTIPMPRFEQSIYPVARGAGAKKAGEKVGATTISVLLTVVSELGTRADLEHQLDVLYASLAPRQQRLVLHQNDQRYWIADAITGQASLVPGRNIAATVPIAFVAESPFAYAQEPVTYSTGALAIPAFFGAWQTQQTLLSPGNAFSYPTITFTNNGSPTITAMTITDWSDQLVVTIPTLALATGQTLTLACDPTSISTYSCYVGSNPAVTTLFYGPPLVVSPPWTFWQIQFSAASQPTVTTTWSWTPRWLV